MGGQVGGQGGCERRIEVFLKIQKKYFLGGRGSGRGGGRVGGVKVDVSGEVMFLSGVEFGGRQGGCD